MAKILENEDELEEFESIDAIKKRLEKTAKANGKYLTFEEIDEALTCEHNFMPVDSTGLVLACTKCGFVVKNKDKFIS